MERIQILSQEPLYYMNPTIAIICVGICLILFGIVYHFILAEKLKMSFSKMMLGIIPSVAAAFLLSAAVTLIFTEPTGKYEYKVIVDDTISVNEFFDEYQIISYDGQIFTVREKVQER